MDSDIEGICTRHYKQGVETGRMQAAVIIGVGFLLYTIWTIL